PSCGVAVTIIVAPLLAENADLGDSLEPIEAPLQGAQAHELVSVPVLPCKPVFTQLPVQLLHPAREAVLKLRVRQYFVEQIEPDPVIARVLANFAGVSDLRVRQQLLYSIANVSHLIVFGIGPNIYRLVVDTFFGRVHEGNEGTGDVAAMNEGPPG